jgi:Protein of unknown function (DUF2934)
MDTREIYKEKIEKAVEDPSGEEEIRQIAYHLWRDEGCPHGRHLDHWFKAESIWHEQQAAKQPEQPRPAKTKRKSAAAAPHTKSRAVKPKSRSASEPIGQDIEKL